LWFDENNNKQKNMSQLPKINEGDFYEVIESVIKKGRQVQYLKQVLKEYEDYKKAMKECLC